VIDDMQQAVDQGVRLAFVAYDDAKACEAAAINLRCAGLLVNVVDKPGLCDFTTPSILDRNPVLIAVGTGGASAGLAKHVRLRLERLLPQTLGKLAERLYRARDALRARFPNGADRRRVLDDALREGGALDPLEGDSYARVDSWLKRPITEGSTDVLVIDLTSQDPEDLTLRQARALGEADIVCAKGEISPAILARARADAERKACTPSSCPLAQFENASSQSTPSAGAPCPTCATPEAKLTVVLRAPK